MGIEYGVLCKKDNTCYWLGKGWPAHEFKLLEYKQSRESFACHVNNIANYYNVIDGYPYNDFHDRGRELWDWCVSKGWDVHLHTDSGDDLTDVPCEGDWVR